ncbi:hypothetical protein HPB51_006667 [Rhipicephalus microplus]|uniref:BLOC-1-related complex subunit 8 n=1 Tax=Rhipicephalus microplus TaxID=6941 RepID=A0A9J6E6M3_RHIMP|nr:BLOC-1-related complex subunit 8 homolog [Rhipicephalus microplus]KAH8030235.1 hypothetical protein HPB51_006667 [Rhipicephalus microplus]
MATEAVTVAEEARPNVDLELEQRVKGTCGRISENVHIFANEPSLACYRLQEHVRKSLQPTVERRLQMAELRQELRGKCYDLDYAIAALRGFQQSRQHLANVQDLMRNAVFMKQQLGAPRSSRSCLQQCCAIDWPSSATATSTKAVAGSSPDGFSSEQLAVTGRS